MNQANIRTLEVAYDTDKAQTVSSIKVNGEDVSKCITYFKYEHEGGDVPEITITYKARRDDTEPLETEEE